MTATTEPTPSQATSSLTPAAPKNVFQRIAGVLFAPGETFADVVRKPGLLAPMIVLLVLYFVSAALVVPRIDWSSANAMQADAMKARNPKFSDADIERMQRYGNIGKAVVGWMSPVFWIGGFAIVAGVLFLVFRLFGGEGTFSQGFAVTMYAWIPVASFRLIRGVVILARGSIDAMSLDTVVRSNLAFLSDFKEHPAAFALLGSLDLFTIWTCILLVIGFAAMSKFSKTKSAAIIVPLWGFLVLIGVAATVLASRMQG
jgi:hypothetical protein